jgi:hypothetical protein
MKKEARAWFLGSFGKGIAKHFVIQKRLAMRSSEIMGLPEYMLRPLQVLDRSHSQFGKIPYVMDQDGLGSQPL